VSLAWEFREADSEWAPGQSEAGGSAPVAAGRFLGPESRGYDVREGTA